MCGKLFKTDLIASNHLKFPKGKFYEDNLFLIPAMFYSNHVVFTNEASYFYFMNQKGRSHNVKNNKKNNVDRCYIMHELMAFSKKNNFSLKEIEEIKYFIVRSLIFRMQQLKRSERILGKEFIKLFLKVCTPRRRLFLFQIPLLTF